MCAPQRRARPCFCPRSPCAPPSRRSAPPARRALKRQSMPQTLCQTWQKYLS